MTTKALKKRIYRTNDLSCCPVEPLYLMIEKIDKNASYIFNQYLRDSTIDAAKWLAAKPLQNVNG